MKAFIRFLLLGNIDSILASISGFLIIYFFTRHGGIGISPDSVVYISVARNIHNSAKIVDYTGLPLTNFPVLYPFFLSILMSLTGIDPIIFGAILNGLLFALVIFVSGVLMNAFIVRSVIYKWIILSCIVLSPALLEIYTMLWSETIFILFVLIFLISIKKYSSSHSLYSLFASAVVTGLASIARYAGVTLILTGCLIIIIDPFLKRKRKILNAFIFLMIGCTPLIINITRNLFLTNHTTGLRENSLTSLTDNLYYFGLVLRDWFPLFNNYAIVLIVSIVFLAWTMVTIIRHFKHHNYFITVENISAIYSLIYCLFIILSAAISRYEQINSRLLSPLFIPLLWTCTYWIPRQIKDLPGLRKKLILGFSLVLAIIFQANQVIADEETWDGVKDAGIPGYTEDQWRFSETLLYLKRNMQIFQEGVQVYSNADDAIFLYLGKIYKPIPHKYFKNEVNVMLAEKHFYLIWFYDAENTDLIDLKFINSHKKIVFEKHFNDGALYKLQD